MTFFDFGPVPLWIYAAAGVAILWGKLKAEQREVVALTKIVNIFISDRYPRVRAVVEVSIYLIIGCFVSMGVIAPATAGQAFAAGLGWAGLTTK